MTPQQIKDLVDILRNETAPGGNTKAEVADILDAIVDGIISLPTLQKVLENGPNAYVVEPIDGFNYATLFETNFENGISLKREVIKADNSEIKTLGLDFLSNANRVRFVNSKRIDNNTRQSFFVMDIPDSDNTIYNFSTPTDLPTGDYNLQVVREKKFIGTINSDGSINTIRNDFATDPSEVFSFDQAGPGAGYFVLSSNLIPEISIQNAVMFIGLSSDKTTLVEQFIIPTTYKFNVNTYNQLTNAYENNLFTNNSIMIIQTIV